MQSGLAQWDILSYILVTSKKSSDFPAQSDQLCARSPISKINTINNIFAKKTASQQVALAEAWKIEGTVHNGVSAASRLLQARTRSLLGVGI